MILFLLIDTSIFLKVLFEVRRISPSNLIIWINLKTLLPIARQQGSNKLYSTAPYNEILPATNTKSVELSSEVSVSCACICKLCTMHVNVGNHV